MTVFSINLIAGRRRQKQRAAALMRLGVYSLFVLAIAVTLLYFMMDAKVQQVQGQVASVQGELSNRTIADSVKRIEYLEGQTALYEPRVQILEKVHSSESDWIRIISDVGACAPADNNLWLTQMTCQRSDKAQTISLRGQAYRQEAIGSYMLRLSQPPWSGDPALGFTQSRKSIGGAEVIDFEVTVPLQMVIGSDLK